MKYEQRVGAILKELVEIPSVIGSSKEKEIEQVIFRILGEMDYFKKIEENGTVVQRGMNVIEWDTLERGVVWGLVKGESEHTIVMMHHHDVVDVSDYGNLSEFAYNIKEIKEKLKEKENLSEEVKQDLLSDKWLFGRGVADMKAGAAIQLAVLERYSQQEDRPYNLLLLSVPDEENMSVGMRQGVRLLKQLKDAFNLSYKLFINSEPHEREKASCGTIYTGSVGKLMPIIYMRGISTHIGNVYEGFNPLLVAEKIVSKLELNTDFCEVVGSEITPPPSIIYLRDRKEEYNVSTPTSVGLYFSLLLLERGIEQVLDKLKKVINEACNEAVCQIEVSLKKYKLLQRNAKANDLPQERKGIDEVLHSRVTHIQVKSFEEIHDRVAKLEGEAFKEKYQAYLEEIKVSIEKGEINLPESTFLLVEKVLEFIPSNEPIVVIAFAPPYYPSVHEENGEMVKRLSIFAEENWQESYKEKFYFMGISDMSYIGGGMNQNDIISLQGNMPQWQWIYDIPFEEMQEVAMPMINVGPWGKDLHKYSERVYKEDAYYHIPQLIEQILRMIIK